MINTASTFAGSAAFVGVGYLLTARWHDGRMDWTSAAAGLAVTGLIVGIALSACANRPSLRGSARWAARRSHCRAAPRATPDRRWSSISRSSPR